MGARATDQGVFSPRAEELSPSDADAIFQRALRGQATSDDAARFSAHMLMEMARQDTVPRSNWDRPGDSSTD